MTDGSGVNHMEYDWYDADRLGDDAWTVGFFVCGSMLMETSLTGFQEFFCLLYAVRMNEMYLPE